MQLIALFILFLSSRFISASPTQSPKDVTAASMHQKLRDPLSKRAQPEGALHWITLPTDQPSPHDLRWEPRVRWKKDSATKAFRKAYPARAEQFKTIVCAGLRQIGCNGGQIGMKKDWSVPNGRDFALVSDLTSRHMNSDRVSVWGGSHPVLESQPVRGLDLVGHWKQRQLQQEERASRAAVQAAGRAARDLAGSSASQLAKKKGRIFPLQNEPQQN